MCPWTGRGGPIMATRVSRKSDLVIDTLGGAMKSAHKCTDQMRNAFTVASGPQVPLGMSLVHVCSGPHSRAWYDWYDSTRISPITVPCQLRATPTPAPVRRAPRQQAHDASQRLPRRELSRILRSGALKYAPNEVQSSCCQERNTKRTQTLKPSEKPRKTKKTKTNKGNLEKHKVPGQRQGLSSACSLAVYKNIKPLIYPYTSFKVSLYILIYPLKGPYISLYIL